MIALAIMLAIVGLPTLGGYFATRSVRPENRS